MRESNPNGKGGLPISGDEAPTVLWDGSRLLWQAKKSLNWT